MAATKRYWQCWIVLALASALTFSYLQSVRATSEIQASLPARKIYKFINGQWFDGKKFQRQMFYSVNGILTQKEPRAVDEVIDLKDGYVVPPFGDAHCHNFDSPYNVAQQVEMYLRNGVFYAKVMTDVRTGAQKVAAQVNKPTSVDVAYAHGGLTGNNSHPIMVYEALALGFYTPQQQQDNAVKIRESRLRENDAYYIIDNATDLENKWHLILAGRPDFIKVFLLGGGGYGKGLAPNLLPQIVAKAHAAGLRVSAHVETAADLHAALMAGVDEMAHVPGFYFGANDDVRRYEISLADAKLMARRRVRAIPTAWRGVQELEESHARRIREMQIRNLTLLKKQGVKFAIGTDSYGRDSLPEAMYLSRLGMWSNLELLNIWCEDTPEDIFPNRKIGHLREGYEASFLVLNNNPLENFEYVKSVRLRFKQGYFIDVAK